MNVPSSPCRHRLASAAAAAAALVALAIHAWWPAAAPRSPRLESARTQRAGAEAPSVRQRASAVAWQPARAAPRSEVSGEIRSSTGSLLAGARVCERAEGGACVSSDGSGRFRLPLTRRGRHTLELSARDHCSTHVELAPRPEAGLALVLRAGGSNVTGWLEDASGGAIEGGLIEAEGSTGLAASATTNEAGSFSLCVPPGPLRLAASADGYAPRSTRVEAPVERVQLALLPAAKIAGRVTAAVTGEGVPGARVEVIDASNGDEVVASVASAAGGAFELVGIPPGRYELGAVAPSWRSARQGVTLGLGEARDEVRIEVDPATTLQVTLELDGVACSAGHVGVSGPVASAAAVSVGSASLDGLPPGRYLTTYSCAVPGGSPAGSDGAELVGGEEFVQLGRAPLTRSYALSSPAAASRREAAPRGSIHVEIGGAAARPGASSVAIYRAGQRLLQPSQRLEAGVLFDGLELGEYDLYLEQAPFVHQHVVLASDGARSDVVLTAPRAAAIVGFVYDAQDNPVIDAKVQAFHRDYPSHELAPAGALVLTDQDGAFRITGLVAGRYRISAAGDGISGELDDVLGDSHGVIVRLDERRR